MQNPSSELRKVIMRLDAVLVICISNSNYFTSPHNFGNMKTVSTTRRCNVYIATNVFCNVCNFIFPFVCNGFCTCLVPKHAPKSSSRPCTVRKTSNIEVLAPGCKICTACLCISHLQLLNLVHFSPSQIFRIRVFMLKTRIAWFDCFCSAVILPIYSNIYKHPAKVLSLTHLFT